MIVSINLSLDNVINVKAYLANENDIKTYNEIYKKNFTVPYPSRTTIVNALPSFLKFEVDCIAYTLKTRKQAIIES